VGPDEDLWQLTSSLFCFELLFHVKLSQDGGQEKTAYGIWQMSLLPNIVTVIVDE
jgi:hypothetical protein